MSKKCKLVTIQILAFTCNDRWECFTKKCPWKYKHWEIRLILICALKKNGVASAHSPIGCFGIWSLFLLLLTSTLPAYPPSALQSKYLSRSTYNVIYHEWHKVSSCLILDRLCVLAAIVPDSKPRGPEFHSWRYQIFCTAVGLKRDPLSLLRIKEELENWD
jgi:hypothetical protein